MRIHRPVEPRTSIPPWMWRVKSAIREFRREMELGHTGWDTNKSTDSSPQPVVQQDLLSLSMAVGLTKSQTFLAQILSLGHAPQIRAACSRSMSSKTNYTMGQFQSSWSVMVRICGSIRTFYRSPIIQSMAVPHSKWCCTKVPRESEHSRG